MEPQLWIDGERVTFSALWVHLKQAHKSDLRFQINIPNEFVGAVFDPYRQKPVTQPYEDYIRANLDEFGTFILEGYLERIRRFVHEPDSSHRWVVIDIDSIEIKGQFLLLSGKVESFRPSL